jgi:hypothetical protein
MDPSTSHYLEIDSCATTIEFKKPWLFCFYTPGHKDHPHRTIGMIQLSEDGRLTPYKSDPNGNYRVKWGPVEVTFKGIPGARINILVSGRARQRGGGEGWITIGCASSQYPQILNSYLQIQFGKPAPVQVGELVFRESPQVETGVLGALLQLTDMINYTSILSKHHEIFLGSVLSNVDQELIGSPIGVMPRALFYYDLDNKGITDAWLYAQLDSYFRVKGLNRTWSTEAEFKSMATNIVAALCVFVNRFKYQPDVIITSQGAIEMEHFCKMALEFQCGDCEELGWVNSMILTRLQRRVKGMANGGQLSQEEITFLDTCTDIMDFYIPVNVLCHARAPELREIIGSQSSTMVERIGPQDWSEEADKVILKEFETWHMTCIVYPKKWYLKHVVDPPIQYPDEFFRQASSSLQHKVNKFHLDRLYAEGTASIYPDPNDQLEIPLVDLGQFVNADNTSTNFDACLLPSANNVSVDRYIYGVVLQHMTDFFRYHSDHVREARDHDALIFWIQNANSKVGVPEIEFEKNHAGVKIKPQLRVKDIDPSLLEALNQEPPLPSLTVDMHQYRIDAMALDDVKIYNPVFWGYFTTSDTAMKWPAIPGWYISIFHPPSQQE